MTRVLRLDGSLQDTEDMLNWNGEKLNDGVDRTWKTNTGKGGTYYGLNCILPPATKKRYVGFLTPSASECDLIWSWGLCIDNQIKRGH